MHQLQFSGTGVALVTPFKNDSSKAVDFVSLGKLLRHVTQEGGVDYLVLMGTTAESVSLTKVEKAEIIAFVAEHKPQNMPIVLGIGANNLQALENDLASLPLEYAQALMLVTPYYNKPTQQGLYAYYQHAHSITQLPLLIYNVPGRTGVNIQPETTIALATDCPRIVGIKEANSDIYHCLELCAKGRGKLAIIAGNDGLVPALCAMGMQGVISVCANAYPVFISQIVRHCLSEAQLTPSELNRLYHLDNLCFLENNPGGIKYILSELNICENSLRLPLVPISTATQNKIRTWMRNV